MTEESGGAKQPSRPRGSELHHRVYMGLWANPDFLACDERGRFVWLYVVAGPSRKTEGMFALTMRDAVHNLAIPETEIRSRLEHLHELGVLIWDDEREHVLLLSALAFQGTTNTNSAQSVVNQAASLRNDFLMAKWLECAQKWQELRLVDALTDYFDRLGIDPTGIVGMTGNSAASDKPSRNTPHQPETPCNSLALTQPLTQPIDCPTPSNDADTPTFLEFWKEWPRKSAKKESETTWNRLSKADRTAAHDRIPEYIADVARSPRDYMLPTTWLRNERWNDMFEPAPAPLSPFGSDRRPDPNEDDILAIAETFAQPETNAEAMGVTAATDPETAKRVARMNARGSSA